MKSLNWFRFLRIILLLGCWLSLHGLTEAKELKLKIRAADGQAARVSVQGKELGSTDQMLSFDITGFPDPIFLDVSLSREGYVPTLHTLEVKDSDSVWEPEPLILCRAVNRIKLRTLPSSVSIKREYPNGQIRPVGKDSELLLEVGKLAPRQPFVPQSVVLILEKPGYQNLRTTLPREIWLSQSYPPEGEELIKMEPAYGLSAWWTRTGRRNLGLVLLTCAFLLSIVVLIRMRFHYLRQVESAHQKLQVWVTRLDSFVEGSRALAAPLRVKKLAEESTLLARRLTRSEWEWVEFENPDFRDSDDTLGSKLLGLREHLRSKPDRPVHLDRVEGSTFSELAPEAHSLMAHSISYEGEYRGFLVVGSKSEAAFSDTDSEALRVLCHQLSGTVERIRLHSETVETYKKLAESEQQLVETAKMAAVGQLAAGVAHELNTPLNAINLGIEMAKRNLGSNPAVAEKRLGLAVTAIGRATEIISKLLYYSREGLMEAQQIQLAQFLKDAVSLSKLQLGEEKLDIRIETDSDLSFTGNPTELTQLVANLVLNARDALLKKPEAEPLVVISSEHSSSELILRVTDHGVGVPDDIQDRVFEPFYSSKNKGKGTGLGLSVSQKIAEHHGGKLLLESPAGPTIFALHLPLGRSES